jgi:hypothetical protein
MNRRILLTAATLAGLTLTVAPAHAGGGKVLKGSYDLTLLPDPTLNVADGCNVANPAAADNHPLTVPSAGLLSVVLDSPDPTGTGNTDWDLFILDADGSVNTGSAGGSSHEEASVKYKKGQQLTISVCNVAGAPQGTVSWTFTPKK